MNKFILFLICFLAIFNALSAGRYAGDFMMIGAGVRPLSMGGAYAATAEGSEAIYWNASGLSQQKQIEFSVMRAYLYENLATYDYVGFLQPLPNEVAIALSWTRLAIDDIPYFSEKYLIGTNVDERILNGNLHLPGTPDDYFSSTDDLFQFGVSKYLKKDLNLGWLFFAIPLDIHIGANIKYIKRELYNQTASGVGIDSSILTILPLSAVFDLEWIGDLRTGFNLQDIGGTIIKWDTQSEHEDEVLMNSKLGLAFSQPLTRLNSEFTIAYDIDFIYDRTAHMGCEYRYKELLAVRGGFYDDNYSAGLGLNLFRVTIDYAFITNPLGNTNRIGLKYTF